MNFNITDEDDEPETLERWYVRDGRRQVVKPYFIVPDFDPDSPGEEM